jgi:hypothetical protein
MAAVRSVDGALHDDKYDALGRSLARITRKIEDDIRNPNTDRIGTS